MRKNDGCSLILAVVLGLLAVVVARALSAQPCTEAVHPILQPPAALWGELEPLRIIAQRGEWDGFSRPDPLWSDIDATSAGFVTTRPWGFQSWTLPGPQLRGGASMWTGGYPRNQQGGHIDWFYLGGDALGSLYVQAGNVGMAAWRIGPSGAATILYQDFSSYGVRTGRSVAVARHAGRDYAVVAYEMGSNAGANLYDLSAVGPGCLWEDNATGEHTGSCPGVWRGRIGSPYAWSVAATGRYVAHASSRPTGVELIDIGLSTPRVLGTVLPGATYVVELWEQSGAYYLGAKRRGAGQLVVLDVTACLLQGSCGAPRTVFTGTVPVIGAEREGLTYSPPGWLWLGHDKWCERTRQAERLLDVRDPASIRDISPSGYWSWYGARGYRPRGVSAIVDGDTLYRAGFTFLESHRIKADAVDPPPPPPPPPPPESECKPLIEVRDVEVAGTLALRGARVVLGPGLRIMSGASLRVEGCEP